MSVTDQQRQILEAACQYVAEGMCVNGGAGCDPDSLDGLCEVCTCRDAVARADALDAADPAPL